MDNNQMQQALAVAKHRVTCIGNDRIICTGLLSRDCIMEVNSVKQTEAITHIEYVIEELSRRISESQRAKASKAKKKSSQGKAGA